MFRSQLSRELTQFKQIRQQKKSEKGSEHKQRCSGNPVEVNTEHPTYQLDLLRVVRDIHYRQVAEVVRLVMADSETKARRKLEEAEKKTRGGGGLLGKIFGGGGSDEAADLFIQHDVEESEVVDDGDGIVDTSTTCSDAVTECDLCGREFSNIVDFESHYDAAHSHQCVACSKMFITNKALDVHSDEKHCPFHKLRMEQNPSGLHFKCYHDHCDESFAEEGERDKHCRERHAIDSAEVIIERRKLAKRVCDLGSSLDKLAVSSRKKNAVPRAIRFGEGQERGFQGVRKVRHSQPKDYDAGNLFKMAKLWKEGGDAFVRAAELHGAKGDSKHDCASQYAEAANCYRKLAVDCLLKTAEIYTDMGRFNMAAKNHVTIAELFETECPDTEQCIQHYQKAADYYKGEESKSSATKCLIKVAQVGEL
ncbi:zinc finger, C2H2 type [Cooperia oncophora]